MLGKQADLFRYCLKRTEKEMCDLLDAKQARIRRLEQIPAEVMTKGQYEALQREQLELNVFSGTYALIELFGNECANLLSRAEALQTSNLEKRATLEKEVFALKYQVGHLKYKIGLKDEYIRQQDGDIDFLAGLALKCCYLTRKEVVHEL